MCYLLQEYFFSYNNFCCCVITLTTTHQHNFIQRTLCRGHGNKATVKKNPLVNDNKKSKY